MLVFQIRKQAQRGEMTCPRLQARGGLNPGICNSKCHTLSTLLVTCLGCHIWCGACSSPGTRTGASPPTAPPIVPARLHPYGYAHCLAPSPWVGHAHSLQPGASTVRALAPPLPRPSPPPPRPPASQSPRTPILCMESPFCS